MMYFVTSYIKHKYGDIWTEESSCNSFDDLQEARSCYMQRMLLAAQHEEEVGYKFNVCLFEPDTYKGNIIIAPKDGKLLDNYSCDCI